MACFHPLLAKQTPAGVEIGKNAADGYQLRLPCGGCLGCRRARAKEWTLRCTLEQQLHTESLFTTLTYDNEHLPPTLDKLHLSTFVRRVRRRSPARTIRYFGCGEYGEKNGRPHYHAILFGLGLRDRGTIQDAWDYGHAHAVTCGTAAIAYVAGYNSKKIGWKRGLHEERVDPHTGEVYTWQPPFLEMSRRPGIGAHARQWTNSWRTYAVLDGSPIPVPRYYHQTWQANATAQDKEELEYEKIKRAILRDTSEKKLRAAEQIAEARQALSAAKRRM